MFLFVSAVPDIKVFLECGFFATNSATTIMFLKLYLHSFHSPLEVYKDT
jgi:hypothetical protein